MHPVIAGRPEQLVQDAGIVGKDFDCHCSAYCTDKGVIAKRKYLQDTIGAIKNNY